MMLVGEGMVSVTLDVVYMCPGVLDPIHEEA